MGDNAVVPEVQDTFEASTEDTRHLGTEAVLLEESAAAAAEVLREEAAKQLLISHCQTLLFMRKEREEVASKRLSSKNVFIRID